VAIISKGWQQELWQCPRKRRRLILLVKWKNGKRQKIVGTDGTRHFFRPEVVAGKLNEECGLSGKKL
jgi:hypothetical protein